MNPSNYWHRIYYSNMLCVEHNGNRINYNILISINVRKRHAVVTCELSFPGAPSPQSTKPWSVWNCEISGVPVDITRGLALINSEITNLYLRWVRGTETANPPTIREEWSRKNRHKRQHRTRENEGKVKRGRKRERDGREGKKRQRQTSFCP